MTSSTLFEQYKNRENTKINLVIYGCFGYSAFGLYILANKSDPNIFVVTLFVLSLLLSFASFYYWYAADQIAYADCEMYVNAKEVTEHHKNIQNLQLQTAFRCFIHLIISYLLAFIATMCAFTKKILVKIEISTLEYACWITFILSLLLCSFLMISHYKKKDTIIFSQENENAVPISAEQTHI